MARRMAHKEPPPTRSSAGTAVKQGEERQAISLYALQWPHCTNRCHQLGLTRSIRRVHVGNGQCGGQPRGSQETRCSGRSRRRALDSWAFNLTAESVRHKTACRNGQNPETRSVSVLTCFCRYPTDSRVATFPQEFCVPHGRAWIILVNYLELPWSVAGWS